MARLKIISRSLALGMRLTDTHEVEEESADGLNPEHPPTLDGFDVLVLDVGDPVLAVNTVNSLREDDQAIPVMLVSGYQPEWEQVEAQEVEGVHVVPLPITRQALLRGVAILLDEDPELIIVDPTGTLPLVGAGTRTNGTLTKDSDAGDGSAEDSTDESAAHGTRQPSGSDPAADDHASDDHAADDHASANHQGSARTQSPPDASSSSSQDPTADADRSSQADTDPAKPSDPAEPSATADAGGPHQDDDTTLAAKPTDPDGQVGSTQPIAREAGSPHPRTSSAPGTTSKRAATARLTTTHQTRRNRTARRRTASARQPRCTPPRLDRRRPPDDSASRSLPAGRWARPVSWLRNRTGIGGEVPDLLRQGSR